MPIGRARNRSTATCYSYSLPVRQGGRRISSMVDDGSDDVFEANGIEVIEEETPKTKSVTIDVPADASPPTNQRRARRRNYAYAYAPTTLPNKYYEEFCIGNVATGDPPKLFYNVDDRPPWPTVLLFALQQIMVCTTCIIVDPLVVTDLVCAQHLGSVRVKLISTVLFVCGLSTLVQTSVGVRLPLMQGASFAFIPPIVVFAQLYPCPTGGATLPNSTRTAHYSGYSFAIHAGESIEHEWQYRLSMVQGTLLIASFVQITLGCTGLVGVLIRHVGPLTIAPLMLMLSFSQLQNVYDGVIRLLLLLLVTALYMQPIQLPVIVRSAAERRFKVSWKPVFALFPYLLAIAVVWFLSAVLTWTSFFPVGHLARTDARAHVVAEAPWAAIPYPGQWSRGYSFHTGLFVGFLASTIASVVESIGDYHACARVVNAPAPPSHAVNRGILAEGLGCMMSALLGGGTSLTTYSESIGAIALTGVASRRILQAAGVLLMFLGVFTKFGAILATMPDPLIGAQLTISLSMIAGVGLSSLTQCDMRCSRNMAIVGLACFGGVLLPKFIGEHPVWRLQDATDTLYDASLQAVNTLLQLQMFVAGGIGFILDNTVPGATRLQRGFRPKPSKRAKAQLNEEVYDLPPVLAKWLRRMPGMRHIAPPS